MAKSLIITEKPSVAQEFARILGVSGRNDGYIENDKYVITWCVGHLVEMVYPEEYDEKYKRWRLEDLPFLPEEYKYNVIPNVSKQYDTVHRMLFREDIETVYWAGDAGKEGQTIEENIRRFGGVRPGMKELRVWIDSQTEEEILRGIREAKPMAEYDNLAKSGIMRTIEDYAMGINFSRAMSVKYGKLLNDAAATKSYTAIAVGRVMTCVLGMVVIREREIRNFAETPFYRVVGGFLPEGAETEETVTAEWKAVNGSKYFESPLLYKENGFKKRESAENLIGELDGKQAVVKSLERGTSRKKAPLLFNLAELQAECSKRYKISPDETLQVAQDLYEKKLTTYPRTDARVLSTAVAKEIGKNLNRLKTYEPTKTYTERILKEGTYRNIARTQYTDDSKITDHYAIIPTGQLTELGSLSDLQRRVYDLVVRRFLSIFYPAAEYETIKLVVQVGAEQLFASAKVLKNPGFLEIMGRPGNDENKEEESAGLLKLAGQLKTGDPLKVDGYEIKEGKTAPPKRYTSGSMVLAMENAGQLICAIAYAPAGNVFKNDQSSTLKAHCDMWRGSSIDADKVAYQWFKLKSDGTWESLAASNSYGITGTTTNEITIPASAVLNFESFKCEIKDTDTASGTYNTTVSDIISFSDLSDPYIVEVSSTTGDKLINGQGSTTINAKVWQNGEAFTDSAADTKFVFSWKKYNKDGTQDTAWGTSGVKTGKTITVTAAEVDVKATFVVELSLK